MSVRRSILLLSAICLVLIGMLAGGLWAVATTVFRSVAQQENLVCPDPTSPYNCKVTPAFIYSVTGIALPPGTKVVSGGTTAWTSWNLFVTVAIPHGAQAPPQSHAGDRTSVTYRGFDSSGRQLVMISQTREAGAPWPKP